MRWGFFAWNVHKKAGIAAARDFLGYPRKTFHTWLANIWLNKNGLEAYNKILNEYKSDGGVFYYNEDYNRDAAHHAICYILNDELEKPIGWEIEEVINVAAEIYDSSLFSDIMKIEKYHPITLPLLVKIIYKKELPDFESHTTWAELIIKYKGYGGIARDALPALRRLLEEVPDDEIYDSERNTFNDAITALEGRSKTLKEEKICKHLYSWVSTPDTFICAICSGAIGELSSERRGKVCKICGYAVHVECQ
ncbi:hypothetical protein HQ585_19630 [candidate division KSB1 bacterium]|nr:hypothetical protein [candidate division KSB1 bacterium]